MAGWPDCVNSAGTLPPSGSVPQPAMTSKLGKFGRLAALPWHGEVYMKLGTMTHEWARSERVAEQLSQSPRSLLTERVGEGLIWQPVSCNPPKQLWNHKDLHCLKRSHHLCKKKKKIIKLQRPPALNWLDGASPHVLHTKNSFSGRGTKKHFLCCRSQRVKQWSTRALTFFWFFLLLVCSPSTSGAAHCFKSLLPGWTHSGWEGFFGLPPRQPKLEMPNAVVHHQWISERRQLQFPASARNSLYNYFYFCQGHFGLKWKHVVH